MGTAATAAWGAPTSAAERAAAPDLARGLALLGIAVANSVAHLYGRRLGPSYRPVDGTAADRAVDVVAALLVDNRGYPLFALLLGYGTAQLAARHAVRGVPVAVTSRILVRRAVGLVAFGAVHAALLFSGDILGLYGLLALVLVAVRSAPQASLLLGAALCLLPFTLLGVLDAVFEGTRSGPQAEPDYLDAVPLRLLDWGSSLAAAPFLGVGLLAPMLLGILAARRRLIDDPARHRRLLAVTAAVGIPVGALGGVPLAMTSTGVWQLPGAVDALVGALHALTGLVMAVGYAALAGLVAVRSAALRAPLVACGRRSLSCYLAQSVLMVPLFTPWGAGLGGELGTAGAAAVAASVWLLTVVWAVLLERLGRRGPAEVLLRRIAYRRQPTERQGSRRSAAT